MNRILVFTFLFATAMSIASAADPMPGKQVQREFKTKDGTVVPYLFYLPEGYKADGDEKYPVVMFLHGRGESHGPLSIVAKWGPPRYAAAGAGLSYILVSPQCPGDDYWNTEVQSARVMELLDATLEDYSIDESRVYLTGLSMGGYGSWNLAARHPDRFAAVAPICGGGDPELAGKLKDLPIWAWHGDRDKPVPFRRSVEMVDAIKAAGGQKIRFTSLEGIGHNCWSAVYATPEFYKWMFSHRIEAR